MQPNSITLPVDELNNGTPVNEVLTRFEEFLNRSVYIGATHSMSAKDSLTLYRTFPKPSGNFKGVSKTAVKFSRDYVVTGIDGLNITAPVIIEVSFSIPVGVVTADVLLNRQRAIALLDLDTVMTPLNDQLMI